MNKIHIQIYMHSLCIHNNKSRITTYTPRLSVPTVDKRQIQIYMRNLCIHNNKSRITAYTPRLSVFNCQNRLIIEPVEVRDGHAVHRWSLNCIPLFCISA